MPRTGGRLRQPQGQLHCVVKITVTSTLPLLLLVSLNRNATHQARITSLIASSHYPHRCSGGGRSSMQMAGSGSTSVMAQGLPIPCTEATLGSDW